MKRQLILAVVDVPAAATAAIHEALEVTAAVSRPIDDHWRDEAREILLSRFPGAEVYRGGHHVALHFPGPMHFGAMEFSPCMGRIIEAPAAKEAA